MTPQEYFKLVVCLVGLLRVTESAKILCVLQLGSRSHAILGSVLFKALAERGHEVTVVSAFPLDVPIRNYRDVHVKELDLPNDIVQLIANGSRLELLKRSSLLLIDTQKAVLSNREVQNLLKNESFDLVIHNMKFADALFGLSYHFNAPSIGFFTSGCTSIINDYTGNTSPLSYVPSLYLPYPTEMTLFQRVCNVLSEFIVHNLFRIFQYHASDRIYREFFPRGPPLKDLVNNVSLVLINTHVSLESPRPYLPNMIQIGGFHIEEPKKLRPDLQDFLDGSTKSGAIFFSLGTNVKLSHQPIREKIETILKVLGKSTLRVLFKSDTLLENVPLNVKVEKWLPQNDILAHPNVKLFISHGGLLSITETVYHGVPIIGIPMFGDQEQNIIQAVNLGFAIKLELQNLDEDNFSEALNEVLQNPKFRNNVNLRSSLLREQPVKPLDLAVFWVEHVLKHRGATHLQCAAMKLTWYQYHLLDVFAVIIFTLVLISVVSRLLLKIIVRCIKRKHVKDVKEKVN